MAQLKPPSGLGAAGRQFWDEVTGEFALRVDEVRLLKDACREMDLIDRLEDELVGAELVVVGSQGQPRANPIIAEIAQHRGLLVRLMQSLKLPEDNPAEAAAGRSAQMRAVANVRWGSGA